MGKKEMRDQPKQSLGLFLDHCQIQFPRFFTVSESIEGQEP